jgi:hypothetical protein
MRRNIERIPPEIIALRQKTIEKKTDTIHSAITTIQTMANQNIHKIQPVLKARIPPMLQRNNPAIPIIKNLSYINYLNQQHHIAPGNYVSVKLMGGIGNRIFQVLAALGYSEKFQKRCVISRSNISNGYKPHEQNLDNMISKIFPNVTFVDTLQSITVLNETTQFTYTPLTSCLTNVLLTGYFQNERYFPSDKLIPSIKTSHYPNTYFFHIRAGDYLTTNEFNIDLVEYYKNCISTLASNVKYIVFSDDNEYAINYMKQFNVDYILLDKTDQLEILIEMANCEGGICANSSFSWLGAFFQDKTLGERFMPSLWIKGKDCSGVYPKWTTVISTNSVENTIVKAPLFNYVNTSPYTLTEWQSLKKDKSNLIVQASSICGGDLWMPFPIGMNWTYVNNFNENNSWQFGSHEKLVLCAISQKTDSRRRPTGINRKQILNNLEKNGIQNIELEQYAYFSLLPSYKFIISPEGNGIDCHRHYETLLAGCIPIIEYNNKIQDKYKGLPILYTTDYSEITLEYLEQKYNEMKDIKYDFSSLFLSYYSSSEQDEIIKCGTYWIKKWCGQNTRWYENIPVYKQVNVSSISWITIINYGYIDFTRNFLESMKKYNSLFHLTVYCLDQEAIDALQGYTNVTCIDTSNIIKNTISSNFSMWGQLEYKTVCFYKLDAISHALKNFNTAIGYIDTDIIVLKDPTDTVINYMNIFPDVDLFTQCDENKNHIECSIQMRCPNFCAGICIFRNNPVTLDLVDYRKRDITNNVTDQDYMLDLCNANNIKRITISRKIFLNGEYPGVNNGTLLNLPSTAELIHYNYIIGKDKINFMKKNSMWFL